MGGSQLLGDGTAGRAFAFAALGVFAAVLQPIAARADMPAPPRHGAGPKGATGSVTHFQEKAGGRILYLEEKGSLLTPVAPPVPGSRREDLPPPAGAAGAPAGKTAAPVQAARK